MLSEPSLAIGPMTPGDVDDVLRIERAVYRDPWSRALFEQELGDAACSYTLVARTGEGVVGYLVAWMVVDELHVGNVAVDPACQHRGIGSRLVGYALDDAVRRGCRIASLEVRVSNDHALALYRRHGFRPVAMRRAYYRDNGEDAVIMVADLDAGQSRAEARPATCGERHPGGRE